MSANKRLRSLASVLWDTGSGSDDEPNLRLRCQECHKWEARVKCLQAETGRLSAYVRKLETEKLALQDRVGELKGKLTAVDLQLFELQKLTIPLGGAQGMKTSPPTSESWLDDIGDLAKLPRMNGVIEQWLSLNTKEVDFNVCRQDSMTASRILQHCEWVVFHLSREPAVYKIGITENCIDRWCNKKYSYKKDTVEKWQRMTVLFVAEDSLACGLVESYLIHRFRGRPGCRNNQPGGETMKKGPGPFFTYCVWRSLKLS